MLVDLCIRIKLQSFGVFAEDAKAAIKLRKMIKLAHILVYRGQVPRIWCFADQGPPLAAHHYLSSSSKIKDDGYVIFAKYFRYNLASQIRLKDESGVASEEFSPEEMTINIACHEVRHCLQHRENVHFFKSWHAEHVKDRLLAQVIKTLDSEGIEHPEDEFDAHIIGYYAMYKLLTGFPASELGTLLRVQPPSSPLTADL